ncbi:MAG TPA: ABC transporter permease, partial [Pyrinomonadaceae bacterium]|nr:ABC transporter permease [Pyrinomonadaceae bacterium]
MGTLLMDLRYGLQMLARNRGFTLVAVLTLALGVGANTALFSVVDAVLLKKLQVKDPDQLVLFTTTSSQEFSPGGYTGSTRRDETTGLPVRTSFPYLTFTRIREQQTPFSDVFAYGSISLNLNADGQADVANGQAVSGNYFNALGVPASLGRTIQDADDGVAARPVVVLSHRYWQKRFGIDQSVVGKQVNLNNVAFTIIGVTPPGFEGTSGAGSAQDIFIPIALEPQIAGERSRMKGAGIWWLRLMGRLKPGATAEQARAALEGVFIQSVLDHRLERHAQVAAQVPVKPLETKDYPHLALISGSQGEINSLKFYERPLKLLFGVVILVLVISCANVANLLLARASSRRREIAVRLALGASRRRLIRQLLTESLLLAVISGAVGVLFALWIKDGLLAVSDWDGIGSTLNPRLDLRVLGFTFGLSLVTGIVFGLMPALRATRLDLTPALKDSRSSSATSRSFLSSSLVVAQVSISLLLLIGAGLLVRTLINLQRIDPGFNSRNLLLFKVSPNLIGYKDERLANLYQQMFDRLEAVPGVRSVTFSRVPLLAQASSDRSLFFPTSVADADGKVKQSGTVYLHQVRENFLETMEIPLLLGRSLSAKDDARSPRVAVVNQAFAQKHFANVNPIGQRFGFDSEKTSEVEIVGLTRDAKYTRQRDDTPATAYLPWKQELSSVGTMTFEVRTNGNPESIISGIRQAVREVDSNLPLNDFKTQVDQADETLAMERLFAKLLSLFGLLAQQLAAIGLYGVVAYSVSQRTHEIGIRMALGANRGNVLKMILKQGMLLILIGVALGLAGAYVLTKYLESLTTMLYGVRPRDPLTFGVTALL